MELNGKPEMGERAEWEFQIESPRQEFWYDVLVIK